MYIKIYIVYQTIGFNKDSKRFKDSNVFILTSMYKYRDICQGDSHCINVSLGLTHHTGDSDNSNSLQHRSDITNSRNRDLWVGNTD